MSEPLEAEMVRALLLKQLDAQGVGHSADFPSLLPALSLPRHAVMKRKLLHSSANRSNAGTAPAFKCNGWRFSHGQRLDTPSWPAP